MASSPLLPRDTEQDKSIVDRSPFVEEGEANRKPSPTFWGARGRPLRIALLVAILIIFGSVLVGVLVSYLLENTQIEEEQTNHIVLLISIDGFRWDYLQRNTSLMPNLLSIKNAGVSAPFMTPMFPSLTFPNHYTIVTGLYPEAHGIVANDFYDPVFNSTFSIGDYDAVSNGRWWGGEPIWVTCEKQGLTAGTYFWPGSEAKIAGYRPTYWERYNGSVPYTERVDTVLEWLDLPHSKRPSFLTMYFEQVDHEGHLHGPDSPEVDEAIALVDSMVGRLLDGLAKRKLNNIADVIVVSDHGMAPRNESQVILLDKYIDLNPTTGPVERLSGYSPVLLIWPKTSEWQGTDGLSAIEAIFANLSNIPNLSIWKKEDVPERFHYSNNRRISPLVALAAEGWSITTSDYYETHKSAFNGGAHGYDNLLPDMRAIFLAQGPSFRKSLEYEPIENIEVYNLMAKIMDLRPAPNNGTLSVVEGMLV